MSQNERVAERLETAIQQLGIALAEVKNLGHEFVPQGATPPVEEYLDMRQLCARIPFKEQTIRNKMCKGELKRGTHFYKRGKKIIFVWSEMKRWLKEQPATGDQIEPFYPEHNARSRKAR